MQRATLTVVQLRSTGREAAILRSGQKSALGTTSRIPAEIIVPSACLDRLACSSERNSISSCKLLARYDTHHTRTKKQDMEDNQLDLLLESGELRIFRTNRIPRYTY